MQRCLNGLAKRNREDKWKEVREWDGEKNRRAVEEGDKRYYRHIK